VKLAAAFALAALTLHAQDGEPILTRIAVPFSPGAGAIKADYAGPISHAEGSQIIPEVTLETAIRPGIEAILQYPLLRVTTRDAVHIGGGQFAAGARWLLAGGLDRRFAVSFQAMVETPTGDSRLAGNATQAKPAVLAQWRAARRVTCYSNLSFDRSIGGATRSSFLAPSQAVAWQLSRHVFPVLEFVASRDLVGHRTPVVVVPEAIVRPAEHLELKAALQVGITEAAAGLGLRVQLAWNFRRRTPGLE
jgi:hypothetical protein